MTTRWSRASVVDLVGEVLLRAAEPVHEDERGTRAPLDHFQADAVVGSHDAHVGVPALRAGRTRGPRWPAKRARRLRGDAGARRRSVATPRAAGPASAWRCGSSSARCSSRSSLQDRLRRACPGTATSRPSSGFAAALVTATLGIVLSAWRWQRVFAAFGVHVPLRASPRTTSRVSSSATSCRPPSAATSFASAGARRTSASSETAFAAVALERLTGFLALPLLCLLGFVIDPALLESDTAWVALLVSGIDARRARHDPLPRRPPHGRPGRFTERRELDAVHRRGARGHRPPPGRPAAPSSACSAPRSCTRCRWC